MKTLKLIFAILLSVSLLSSCKKDKKEDPVPVVQKSQQELDLEYLSTQGVMTGDKNSSLQVISYVKNGVTKYTYAAAVNGDALGQGFSDFTIIDNKMIDVTYQTEIGTYVIDKINKKLYLTTTYTGTSVLYTLNLNK